MSIECGREAAPNESLDDCDVECAEIMVVGEYRRTSMVADSAVTRLTDC